MISLQSPGHVALDLLLERDALARQVEAVQVRDNLVWRLIAEAHRKYPDAPLHWVNADDLRRALDSTDGHTPGPEQEPRG